MERIKTIIPRIKEIKPLDNYMLSVLFHNGKKSYMM